MSAIPMALPAVPEIATPPPVTVVAASAGLRYVTDTIPGITRRKRGKHFVYYDADGQRVTDETTLERIRHLGIPPAYTEVWISPFANSHLQATGRDARGRKQYRYHPRWRAVRDEAKYDRMIAFGEHLPALRQYIAAALDEPDLTREKVLATVVRLLDLTLIRIGNEEYARANHSYGLTTLQNEHIAVTGNALLFHFRGKHGKEHVLKVRDPRVARIVKRCRDLPGHELFQYLDDTGQHHPVTSDDVNSYLQALTGDHITAKDFRTWGGTVSAIAYLASQPEPETRHERDHFIVEAIKIAANKLGNTPAICRKCYVHPGLIDRYREGQLFAAAHAETPPISGLNADESRTLFLLHTLRDTLPTEHADEVRSSDRCDPIELVTGRAD